MKKLSFVLTPLLALSIVACAQGRKTTKKKKQTTTTTTTTTQTKGTAAPEITSVTLHRGACFGRCPIYSLRVDQDGMLTYTGERNTDMMGVYQKKATPEAARKLLKEFQQHRADTCVSEYQVTIADIPTLSYQVIAGGNTIFINNANFGPHFLSELGIKVDDLGKNTAGEWVKIGDGPR